MQRDVSLLLARLLIAPMFLISGISKAIGWPGVVQGLSAQGLPLPMILGGAATAIEIVAPVLLIVGLLTRYAAFALIAFTLIATLLFHNFWDMEGGQQMANQIMFLKNLAVVAALILIAQFGAGRYAVPMGGKRST